MLFGGHFGWNNQKKLISYREGKTDTTDHKAKKEAQEKEVAPKK